MVASNVTRVLIAMMLLRVASAYKLIMPSESGEISLLEESSGDVS